MLLKPQIVVLDAFCGIKNTQKLILAGALPGRLRGSFHRSPIPYSWWEG